MSLVEELKRRKVFKVGAAYLVVAWIAVQAASIGFPAFDAPPWVLRVLILVTFLGFPIALVMAWVIDVGPGRVTFEGGGQGRSALFAVAALLAVVAVGWYVYGQPAFRKSDVAGSPSAATAQPAASEVPKKSIAVLPFTDLSPGKDQEYFSDGMAEEILNALAKVKDLKVAGRTSAFSFKGKNEDLREIGKALAVAHVLEGSVRKQGEKVRITAQLIQAEDGYHLWSESYDGDMKDVFALQERIARAITGQLQVLLTGAQAERLVPEATSNPDAHSLYLQATAIFNRRDGARYADAIAALEQAVKLDPDYAHAYSRLAALYTTQPTFAGSDVPSAHAKVEEYSAKAIALDPTLAEPYAAQGYSHSRLRGHLLEERAAFERARELDPDDATSAFWFGLALSMSGYRRDAERLLDHALKVEPMLPNLVRWRAVLEQQDGQMARAEIALKRARDLDLRVADYNLADVADARGDKQAAVRLWASGIESLMPGMPIETRTDIARGIYGDAAARARAVAAIEQHVGGSGQISGLIPSALLRLGESKRALALMRDRQNSDFADSLTMLWTPQQKALRATPEFAAFVQDFGFPALWDRYGPPDACRKDAKGAYACD